MGYRGRLAPTPTGFLHLGHAATFFEAYHRSASEKGTLILRIEDIDSERCRERFVKAAIDDLRWLGLQWAEGPDVGGPYAPYNQSERRHHYLNAWRKLKEGGFIYPSEASRREIERAASAPHGEIEPLFPLSLRPPPGTGLDATHPGMQNWRLRVPDNSIVTFRDGRRGELAYIAGVDFGDFLVWRRVGGPSYELAVVVDDALMEVTEVVRGEDLLLSTARQLLVYRALGYAIPAFYHTPLLRDATGQRLAKRDASTSISSLRAKGWTAEAVREEARRLASLRG
ncbi:MAG: glutamate--tRNA ligase family protein [Verrucomicrobiia bacterium]